MSIVLAPPSPGLRVGRFRLKSELGRGAQATVWRAHDEQLDREVAIKLLDPAADNLALSQWMHEARAVGRLAHPNIVPLFEAGEIDGRPCLVFELVNGRTLAAVLRQQGAMPPRDAVATMVDVLDALRVAHEHGIVHRDLKPSNILVDGEGRARVMDFGIAARLADGADGRIVGTPGYMSPEAARGEAPSPGMDVFSAGLVLAEMMSGQRLVQEKDPFRALHRAANEDLAVPAEPALDDALRSIVQRALARERALRHDSIQAFRDALQGWLGRTDASTAAAAASGSGTLDFLLRRMRHKTDFPALSQSVVRIQRIATSEHESLGALSSEILKDVALSNKLLRLVNTAHFRGAGGGSISTVSRAVALVGFAGIRNMALSLMLIEHMKDKAHAQRLRGEFLRALTAGQLASDLAGNTRESEEAFLGGMLFNLGRLLTEYYLPEEAMAIRERLASPSEAKVGGATGESVSTQVLGIGFEALGLGVARSWGLPDTLQRCMTIGHDAPPQRPVSTGLERLRWITAAANDAADALLKDPAADLAHCLHTVTERYGKALSLGLPDFKRAAEAAKAHVVQMSPALGLPPPERSPVDRSRAGSEAPTRATAAMLDSTEALVAAAGDDTSSAATLILPDRTAAIDVAQVLAAGIQDITDSLAADRFDLNSVLRMVLEAMYRGLALQRVLLCLRDARSGVLVGRFGLGEGADALSPVFRVALPQGGAAPQDLLAAVCMRNADTLIADASLPAVSSRLPAWYRQRVHAPTFVLLPMALKGAPLGLIYGDKAAAGSLVPNERELSLLRTLRNQAVMAFRHAS
ncbi:serine/threonine protein kinase [Ideonella sp. A 288]|uniref:serine/threonine protein kinase n=1 Tax=Ideonella sp. A 288 TaxID=1962181 RepID=UPI000B4B60E9|nr:serine/threonine protein kinase [Ideonella sp. A 288]